jgi:hypothetical protein
MLDFFIEERGHPWTQDGGRTAHAALTLFETNPFAAPTEMKIDDEAGWEAYDRARAARILTSAAVVAVAFRADSAHALEGSISCHPAHNIIKLSVDDGALASPEAAERAVEFVARWRSALPRFCWGEANADREIGRFYAERNLPWLPECFGAYLGWHRVLSPLGYAPYFTAENLRAVPAFRVAELPGEAFAITAYPDPLGYASSEAREYVVAVTRALDERRLDATESGSANDQ